MKLPKRGTRSSFQPRLLGRHTGVAEAAVLEKTRRDGRSSLSDPTDGGRVPNIG